MVLFMTTCNNWELLPSKTSGNLNLSRLPSPMHTRMNDSWIPPFRCIDSRRNGPLTSPNITQSSWQVREA